MHIPDDVDDTYFTTSSTVKPGADASKQDLLNDLYTVRRICSKAQGSSRLCRHEAAWNSTIHHPLLDLAFRAGGLCSQDPEQHAEVRVENITSATIVGDCIPRWSAAGDVHETATVGVWSVSQESAGNPSHESMSSLSSLEEEEDPFSAAGPFDSTCHLDSTCHSKVGSKKADFALVVVPPPDSVLQTSIEVVLHHLEETPLLSRSINPSTYMPLLESPVAIAIETKTVTASRDALTH